VTLSRPRWQHEGRVDPGGPRGGPARGHRRPAGRVPPPGRPPRARLPGRTRHGTAHDELTLIGSPCQQRL